MQPKVTPTNSSGSGPANLNIKKQTSSNSLNQPKPKPSAERPSSNALQRSILSGPQLDNTIMGNPNTEISALPGTLVSGAADGETHAKRLRILDQMARIVVQQKADEPYIFSFHYEYKEHLQYYGFIDPESAKRKEEKERIQKARLVLSHLKPVNGNENEDDEAPEGAPNDMSESAVPWEESESMQGAGATSGKNRFDTLLKSLIARIEFSNTLAPIQEYGRHH